MAVFARSKAKFSEKRKQFLSPRRGYSDWLNVDYEYDLDIISPMGLLQTGATYWLNVAPLRSGLEAYPGLWIPRRLPKGRCLQMR